MRFLTFGNRLNAVSWAREAAKVELGSLLAPPPGARSDPGSLEIDLSSCRSADFLILGRLLILLEALAGKGLRIAVRPPSKDTLEVEQAYLENDSGPDGVPSEAAVRQISRRRMQRANCRLFIEQSGFFSVLRTGPLRASGIEIKDAPGVTRPGDLSPQDVEPDQYDVPRAPLRRRGIIPYHWIDITEAADNIVLTDPVLRSLRGLGLAADDATALTRGVLDELIENARNHGLRGGATGPWALVGGELTHPQSYSRRIDDFDSYLQDFVKWSAKEPSPLLRLFIGDAGRGIPASLEEKKASLSVSAASAALAGTRDALASGQAILTALDHHSAYDHANREPQGLWKVKRVVRSFQGALLITSGAAAAGYIFDADPEGHQLNIAAPASLPGTMVECTVLTAPGRDIRPQEDEVSSPVPPLAAAASKLSCITALLKPSVGFDTEALGAIQDQLDRLKNVSDGGVVIAVEMPPHSRSMADSEIERAIQSVLEIASKAANPTTVTLVFPGISRRLLSVAIDTLNRRLDKPPALPPSMHTPILVISPENIHYWAGGTPLVRQLLSILSQSSEKKFKILEIGQALRVEAPAALEREIRDQPRLLHLDRGTITLKLRPQDAVDSLSQFVSMRLQSAVTGARAPGVTKGKYLTPSLRITGRWIDMQILLSYLRCHQITGLVLAEAVKKRTGFRPRSPRPTVVSVGSLDDQVASVFSLALSGVADTFESVAALRMSKDNAMRPGNRQITICTDLVSRGASVRRAIRELQDMGFADITVATIIDGRDLGYADEHRDFLRVRDAQVPIISLGCVSLDSDPNDSDARPLPIDPVTETPLTAEYPHSRIIGRQDLYLKAIKESEAARLGHISRPGERHYTAYINPSSLFDYKPWSETALQRITSFVVKDNEQIAPAGKGATVGIIYPTEYRNEFSRVAESLADAIEKAGLTCLEPISIPRSSTGIGWAFPRFARIPAEASHIVAIDSTSKTGRTLRELIRLASVPGTAFISCFGLIHGMNDLTAMSLQQVRRVATYSIDDPLSRSQGTVPVSVRYLVRTAVSGSDASHCSVCALRRTYLSLPSTLPRSMTEHRRRLDELLTARDRETVFEELATDLFGVHITQDDCVAYLEWRSFLEEAASSTASRASVVQRLSSLAAAISRGALDEKRTRERDALVRLIAAEHNRLEQAPLWFTTVRDKLVHVARSVLGAPGPVFSDPMLRAQALIVFARADARSFCSQYAEIVRSCRDHQTVVSHALLEALVLLEQDWNQTEWRAALVEQIAMLSHELRAESADTSKWDFRPVEELAYLSGVANREQRLPPNSPQQAWSQLKDFCDSVKRHQYDQAMWRLQRRLELIRRGRVPSAPASGFSDWELCSMALDEHVFSNLSQVRGALTSDDLIDRTLVSRDDRLKWRELIDGAGRERLNDISVAVGNVFLGNDPLTISTPELEDLGRTLDRWSQFFFYFPGRSDRSDRTSLLTRIVDRCPAALLEALTDVFDGSDWDLELGDVQEPDAVMVFCSYSALADTLAHVQINAQVTHRQEGQAPRFKVEVRLSGVDKVEVSILNDASSRVTRGGGHGLDNAAQRLAPFGAILEPVNEVPTGWTYGIRIVLERWKWN